MVRLGATVKYGKVVGVGGDRRGKEEASKKGETTTSVPEVLIVFLILLFTA